MNIRWISSDKVVIETDAMDYGMILSVLAILLHDSWGVSLPRLSDIHDAMFKSLVDRHDMKQTERNKKK